MIYRRTDASRFLLALVLLCGTISAGAQDAVHVVAKGETVYSISRMYEVSPDALMKYNGIADPSKLQTGHTLKIPRPAPPQSAGFSDYRAVKGDTLYSIARKQGVSVQVLCDVNGFSKDYKIKEGERIKIPGAGVTGSVPVIALPGNGKQETKTAQPAPPKTAAAAKKSSGKGVDLSLRWPVRVLDSAYMNGKLYGVALTSERSEPVKSLTEGKVISAGPYRGWGRVAIVQANGGYMYVYGGCESLSVKEGDTIGPGTELGRLGIDSISGEPRLFLVVYRGNTAIDPAKAPRA